MTSPQAPRMGPTLRATRARPIYEDAILHLIQEDEDGIIHGNNNAESIAIPPTQG
jgi:hypothetical protein